MIVLKEGKEKNLLKHHPWVFSGAMESRSLPAEAGVQKVVDSYSQFVAWGYYDPLSHIELRLLSWKESDYPDDSWWKRTVRASVLRRSALFRATAETNVFRLIHGEADMLPGFACDVYSKIIRIIVSARVAWAVRETVVSTLEEMLHPEMIILNTDSSFCGIERLTEITEYYKNGQKFTPTEKLEEIKIRESGLYYSLTPGSGQKSGFFCDQRENRNRAEVYMKGATVLDGCCYTGAFTLHALRAGCESVDAYDSSSEALHQLLSNVNMNEELKTIPEGSRAKVNATKGDIFEVMRQIEGNHYDVMVLDPPKLAQTIRALENARKAYKDLNRLAMEKIKAGGIIITCSCSGSLTREDFKTVLAWAAKDAAVEVQILETLGQDCDHPIRLSFPESEYLKVFILRVIK